MKIGIIDLGTNTFNLLIAEIHSDRSFETLLNTKSAVMLGQEGINQGIISDRAFTRAYSVLSDFRKTLDGFNCDKEVAFGTSAIRSAQNSEHFIRKIKEDLNILIDPITGDMEAEYIYRGIRKAVPLSGNRDLMLDIGGGSNEFIIANNTEIFWKHSFPLGGARLLEKFNPGNPIETETIVAIYEYFEKELVLLKDAINIFPCTTLIGSSGAFDSFANIYAFQQSGLPVPNTEKNCSISSNEFLNIAEHLITSTKEERLLIPGLEAIRVNTIVMSAIFTKFIVEKFDIKEILCSAYALKEGVADAEAYNMTKKPLTI
jgi:exopolyphosphatase/guanosine-5'-triphosphate,3'-diphosphate pyrophosphatase